MRKKKPQPQRFLSPAGRRSRSVPGVALAVGLVLLPVTPASARQARRVDAPPPGAPAVRPAGEAAMTEALAAARFRRLGARHTLRGRNGIKVETALGRWRARGGELRGARVEVKSPWGEKLEVDLFLDDAGLLAVLNGRIRVSTAFDGERHPRELRVTVDGETTTTYLGDRAWRIAAGAPIPADFDWRAQRALALALGDELSPAFRAALGDIDRPAQPAGCSWELAACVAAITAWVIDVALLPAACVVGGVPTFGVSCALAIVGHELASAAVVSTCGTYSTCRQNENIPPEEPDESTPIVVDMDGRGFRLTGLDDPVIFDLTGDGVLDRVSWTARGGDEAFLALDRNGNGRIDHGGELFGSRTPLVDGTLADHGFLALTEYDLRTMGGDESGAIDAADAMYDRLLLWTDRDHDGISEPGELRSLRQAGVVSLSLDYVVNARRDRHGNRFVLNSRALVRVHGRQQVRAVSDVYFQIAQ